MDKNKSAKLSLGTTVCLVLILVILLALVYYFGFVVNKNKSNNNISEFKPSNYIIKFNSNILGEKDGFLIRLAKAEDAAGYFEQNFCPLDQEVVRLTGCKEEFTKDEVVSLRVHRLTLDVYSFNPRAEKTYLKAGFKREGVLKDAVKDGDQYADDILMAILEDEWRELK